MPNSTRLYTLHSTPHPLSSRVPLSLRLVDVNVARLIESGWDFATAGEHLGKIGCRVYKAKGAGLEILSGVIVAHRPERDKEPAAWLLQFDTRHDPSKVCLCYHTSTHCRPPSRAPPPTPARSPTRFCRTLSFTLPITLPTPSTSTR